MTVQQTDDDLIALFANALRAKATAARSAQALADQHKMDADRYRDENIKLTAEIKRLSILLEKDDDE